MKSTILSIWLVIGIAVSVSAQWTEPVRISYSLGLFDPRAVAIGETLHVVACGHTKFYYLRSNDNGDTWTDPICPVDTFYGSEMPDITYSNGFLHLACKGRVVSGQNTRFFHLSSNDGGRTWSEPHQIYINGWKYPRIVASHDTIFFSGSIPGQILFLISTDNGETWSDPSVIDSVYLDHPPNLLYSNGRLHAVYQAPVYHEPFGIEIYYSYSDDYGLTWSDRFPLSTREPLPGVKHSQFPSAYIDSDGNLIALWFDYKYGSECGFSGDILGRVSNDNGATWLPETRLTYTQTGGSSSSIILDNRIHAIWQDEDPFGCGMPKIMYSESSNWGITWENPVVITDTTQLGELDPFLLYTFSSDDTTLHCIMRKHLPDGSYDLYYIKTVDPYAGLEITLTPRTTIIPVNNGHIIFDLNVINNGYLTVPVWAQLQPILNDCLGIPYQPLFINRNLTGSLAPGETFTGHYFITVNNIIGLSSGGVQVMVGPEIGEWLDFDCFEITFYYPFGMVGGEISIDFGEWLEYSGDENLPAEFSLSQNYPNPFNAITTIHYSLPEPSNVTLEIFNLFGQRIETLIDDYQDAGYKSITWNASAYSSGIYFYKLTFGEKAYVKRMTIIK